MAECIMASPATAPPSPCKTTVSSPSSSTSTGPTTPTGHSFTTADDWYLQGERLWYDPNAKEIVDLNEHEEPNEEQEKELLRVFQRVVRASNVKENVEEKERWMTFLPNNPEGSYGFHRVEEALSGAGPGAGAATRRKSRCDTDSTEMSMESLQEGAPCTATATGTTACSGANEGLARLYLDYQGQGDSDTPSTTTTTGTTTTTTSASSDDSDGSTTKQRADLVEALWAVHGIQRTVVVSAGDSSLVVMELLQRQRQRLAAGSPFPKILHVLSLNGRYCAKTRHTSQLATITQILRSDWGGHSLAAKAQRSEFTLSQCIQPYLKGSSRHVRKQVAHVVRRNNGAASLVEMARTVDDHLHDKHRYRWHLPHLYKAFTMDQGITLHLVTTDRAARRQTRLVQQHLQEHQLEKCAGVTYTDYGGRPLTTSTFLMDTHAHTQELLEEFVNDIQKLANQEIPMSDNSASIFDAAAAANPDHQHLHHHEEHDEDEDSWHQDEVEGEEDHDSPSLDSRLHTEIIFDAADMNMDDDDFELF